MAPIGGHRAEEEQAMAGAGSYDAIVIGGGHNGLVAAAYLGKAGLRTLVLERRGIVGGSCVTEEVWPGFHVSTTSYVLSMFHGRLMEELELHRFGFELIPTDNLFVPFEDGRYMILWDDEAKTCAEIAKFSKRDAERYSEYNRFLAQAAGFVRELAWKTPPASLSPGAARDMLELGWKFRRMGGAAFRFIDLMTESVVDFLDRWFESDQLKATLAYYGVIGNFKGPMTPGSAYVLLHHLMGEHEGAGGWGFIRGGMGGLTQALARCAQAAGATILTDAEVERVTIRDGRAVGVALANGDTYTARAILSNADPKTTYLRLIGRENLDGDVVAEIESYKTFSTAFKINFALDHLPTYSTFDREKIGLPFPTYIHIGPTVEYLERAYDDAKYGRPSTRPFLSPVVPTLTDPSLAPEGKHILNVFGGHAPYELAGTTWDEERETFADTVVETLAEFAPDLRDCIIDRQILMPPDLERIYALPQGHIFHGELTLDQLFFLRPVPGYGDYRTPIRGMYLCGSGTHPGGGVYGLPGHNAAREAIRDLKGRGLRRRG